ncbi:hypothetical protein GCM10010254_23190 [Streptomyces chromofuscus]|nr:hypothetical protein GCM10010254_23190 [Streptomyces chromofuscus]
MRGQRIAFATKGELAKTMVVRALASPLPIAWAIADSACVRYGTFAVCWRKPPSGCWSTNPGTAPGARGPT